MFQQFSAIGALCTCAIPHSPITRGIKAMSWLAVMSCVTACTSFVPATLLDMRNIDRGRMDVTALAGRMDFPIGLMPLDGKIALTVHVYHADDSKGVKERFVLNQSIKDGRITVSMNPADKAKADRLQSAGRKWAEEEKEDIGDSYNVHIEGCRTGEAIDLRQRVNVDVRWDFEKGFKPLMRGVRLKKLLGDKDVADLPMC